MGWRGRGGGWAGTWPGRGPFSDLPPWQRPGWQFGFGRGFGRRCSYPYSSSVCARFPWLPRRWWANSQYAFPLPLPTPAMSQKDEVAALEDYMKNLQAEHLDLEQEMKEVESRIRELKSATERQSEQGT